MQYIKQKKITRCILNIFFNAIIDNYSLIFLRYALKIINVVLNIDEIPNEYMLLMKLESPYLTKLVNDSFYFCEEYYCFAMEYCEVFFLKLIFLLFYCYLITIKGGSLKELIEENKFIDRDLILNWSEDIIYGLNYLHTKKIIHTDIKPGCLFFQILT